MAGIDNIRPGQSAGTQSGHMVRNEQKHHNIEKREASISTNSDAVSLSQQGKVIDQMHSNLVSQPSFDQAKVSAIKDAIANGSYKVDADLLAKNIMKHEKEFSGA
ncbi:flagellar biosynthesis anti-sigma factor FlgM [Vibrio sp.]|nr:flagellar biosynthesis anti-sigma factor FlgM [Vibrio sp.]